MGDRPTPYDSSQQLPSGGALSQEETPPQPGGLGAANPPMREWSELPPSEPHTHGTLPSITVESTPLESPMHNGSAPDSRYRDAARSLVDRDRGGGINSVVNSEHFNESAPVIGNLAGS